MAGLLETVVILWRSIHRSLENNKEARVYTVDKFASVLPQYMRVFTVRRLPGAVGQPPCAGLSQLPPGPAALALHGGAGQPPASAPARVQAALVFRC